MDSCNQVLHESRFRQVGVLGGKTTGNKGCYKIATTELGAKLASKGINVVYSGELIGLLEILSQVIHAAGGHVINSSSTSLEHEQVIFDLHQRKEEFAKLSDCFIVLPGDLGAMEEFMEIVSWAQLGIHDKPIGLFNVDGFFDSFLAQIDTAINEGFIKPSQKKIIIVSNNANDLLKKMEEYKSMHEGAIPKQLWEAEAGSSEPTV